ncbi:glutathione S-transferase [Extensimonas vulgaris]|uniref:Glutathione S-transferase-like protein n=1 Tax=Extensimonas vulgaris TaxID=1031594 RepID=A0A369AL41_9BURK|nr:hypothetical protein DFR45_10364 [Extensimonas vulgaris]TWI36523.1 glutathione S-transferase [Extensimonas vulgaris]
MPCPNTRSKLEKTLGAPLQRIALLTPHQLQSYFSNVDAYFAPVCMRLITYGLPVPPHIAAYVERVRALPGVQDWIAGALAEQDFRAFEEPYRLQR